MSHVPPSDDDDPTVVRTAPGAGAHGQFVSSSSFLGHTLPEGTRVGGLEITGLIGEGGFGIVYLAYDANLQRQVAVKEYMPSSLAARASGAFDVVVKSERHVETFKAGQRSFVNEARLLARFDHPSLVKVYRFWEANGTAYMAMPYYEGPTLKRALAELGHPPDEAMLRGWLNPLLDALAVMHKAHCYHRDIAPDNILLTPGGPLLLDFGAARRVIGDLTHALTVVLKPGYAPIEQYGEVSTMAQGAWTDLYALACVVYHAITGKTPMSSVERLMSEGLEPLSRIGAGRYSAEFLRAMDAALAVKPQDRPQDVAQFRALLDAGRAPPPPAPAYAAPDIALEPVIAAPPPPPRSTPARAEPTAWATQPAPLDDLLEFPPDPAAEGALRPAQSRTRFYVLAAIALLAALAAGAFLFNAQRTRVEAPAPVPTEPTIQSTPAPQVDVVEPLPSPAPLPEPEPEPIEAAPAAPPREPTPAPSPPPAPRVEPPRATRIAPPPAPAPTKVGSVPARCSDILQKASLEPMTAEEAAYLKRECR